MPWLGRRAGCTSRKSSSLPENAGYRYEAKARNVAIDVLGTDKLADFARAMCSDHVGPKRPVVAGVLNLFRAVIALLRAGCGRGPNWRAPSHLPRFSRTPTRSRPPTTRIYEVKARPAYRTDKSGTYVIGRGRSGRPQSVIVCHALGRS